MDLHNEQGTDVVAADEPKGPVEVYIDPEQPFERPAKDFVPGPFYKNVEERVPEIDEARNSEAASAGGGLAVDRRDFMRMFTASALVGSVGACVRRPEEKAIPYVNQPADHVIGEADYYATTCGECQAACGVVVKTKGGRPIKIEGDTAHPISQGATCALGQSTLQSLYHPERRKKASMTIAGRQEQAEWDELFERLGSRIKNVKNMAILTGGSTGHRRRFFQDFLSHMGFNPTHVYTYEANALLATIAAAHEQVFGTTGLPRMDLGVARTIVGIGSDFLDVGISPVLATKDYAKSHSFKQGKMGKLIQFESNLTNTGARAHDRHVIPTASELVVTLKLVAALLNHPASKGSAAERAEIKLVLDANREQLAQTDCGVDDKVFSDAAAELLSDASVVLCGNTAGGLQATDLQRAAIMANLLIGAYGSTLHFDKGWMPSPVTKGSLEQFVQNASSFDALIVIDANPAFSVPTSFGLADAVKSIETVISIQSQNTETDAWASVVLPGRHYLECWGDEEAIAGLWSIRQPTIRPTTDSRQAEDILLWLASAAGKPMKAYREYRDYLREQYKVIHKQLLAEKPDQTEKEFEAFWSATVRRGFVMALRKRSLRPATGFSMKVEAATSGLRLSLPLDKRFLDGRGADRPILQEVGDSLSTVTWDNWVAIHPHTAKAMGFRRNDVLQLKTSAGTIEAALYPMPGLHKDAVVIYRGYGRAKGVNKVTDGYGVDVNPLIPRLLDRSSGQPVTMGMEVELSKTGKRHALAAMQKHNDIANRHDIVVKTSLAKATASMGKTKDLDTVPDLYPKLPAHKDYRWGMAIDLTSCTGCSACMVACAVENNIPQIGREQVRKGREMHWIRLDRYFAGPVDNPEVTFQPVMCQHCNHAPCEAVCPVYATVHDPEGQNAQVYNRCVGTRYCANACPYKVRRFNWFTHEWHVIGDKERDRNLRALNPDVTVRTRGIMEKCSFCVQRIRDAKHKAKEKDLLVRDGDLKTACQQVCPSDAIQFGNLADPESMVSKARRDARAYTMLNGDPDHHHYGIKTLPNVSYLAEVTHKESAANHHGSSHTEEHG